MIVSTSKNNPEVEAKYRKTLMTTSFMLFIYSFAGGQFNGELSLSGSKFVFSRPQYLEYFAVVMIVFFAWRHYQASKSIRERLDKAKIFDISIFSEKLTDCEKSILKGFKRIEDAPEGCNQNYHLVSTWRFDVCCCYTPSLYCEDKTLAFSLTKSSALRLRLYYVRSLIVHVLVDSDFGDACLPSLCAVISILTYVYNAFS